jgi:hypothetical protein
VIFRKTSQVLREDEILALSFLAVAVFVSAIYGYPFRYYILSDILYHYLIVAPIFFVYLFYTHISNPYLRFGWTALSLSPTVCLLLIVSSDVFYGTWEHLPLTWILKSGIFLWCGALVMYILTRPGKSKPLFSDIDIASLVSNVVGFLRDWWPIFVVLFAYCMLKSIIPVVNSRLYDEAFSTLDYLLFLNHDPVDLTLKCVPVSWIRLLSFGYTSYILLKIFAFSAVYCFTRDGRAFHRMVFAFSFTLIIGMAVYFLFPAQGPIYYYPEKFRAIEEPMSKTTTYHLQRDLWTAYEQVKQHTPEEFYELTRASGVRIGLAAFPSLHIAISCVLLYFLFIYHRFTFWLFLFPSFLMAIATIYFGWHYAVDNIAGFLLAGLVIIVVHRSDDGTLRSS